MYSVCVVHFLCVYVRMRMRNGSYHNFPAVSCTLVDVFVKCASVFDSGETGALP